MNYRFEKLKPSILLISTNLEKRLFTISQLGLHNPKRGRKYNFVKGNKKEIEKRK
jgi:hypothetical protein